MNMGTGNQIFRMVNLPDHLIIELKLSINRKLTDMQSKVHASRIDQHTIAAINTVAVVVYMYSSSQ